MHQCIRFCASTILSLPYTTNRFIKANSFNIQANFLSYYVTLKLHVKGSSYITENVFDTFR